MLFPKRSLCATILSMTAISLWCNRIILGSFYALFLFTPLAFTGETSELFEFNKMWVVFILTLIIGAAWISKMIFEKRLYVRRTPFDIPILLFLLSQIISTIFSLDRHISFWGYYTRFNGGLLSTVTYVFLYYAFVSHVSKKHTIKMLLTALFSGLIVALWGLPSHFGYDPTCYLFRGEFNVKCWTDAFQPKVRIFSTLGQPAWLAAHLAVLIPIAAGFLLSFHKKLPKVAPVYYIGLILLFYVDLLYTRTRAGFLAIVVAFSAFILLFIVVKRVQQKPLSPLSLLSPLPLLITALLVITFFLGTSIQQVDKFTYENLKTAWEKPEVEKQEMKQSAPVKKSTVSTGEMGGTDSGKIRTYVWQGALEIWKNNPLFGTGVETFAFAYYGYRPAEHNLTSEWDYLYNKAHNEFLNYLATTGLFGLGTYLTMIALFFWVGIKQLNRAYSPVLEKKQKHAGYQPSKDHRFIVIGLIAGYASILISNFFGFSVVTINLFLFLIPACVLLLENMLDENKIVSIPKESTNKPADIWQYAGVLIIVCICVYHITVLYRFWDADKKYAYGLNLDRAGYYQHAQKSLRESVELRPDEPTFKDELVINDAVLAIEFAKQNEATAASQLAQEAVSLSDSLTTEYPNNIIYWKTRVRTFASLSQFNPAYLTPALEAIQTANKLAPTDAKVSYNLGLVYSRTNQTDKAIKTFENTIRLKKNYKDAYYELALAYRQKAIDSSGKVVNTDYEKKATDTMQFILDNFDDKDPQVLKQLEEWKK